MLEMQKACFEGHQGPGTPGTASPQRFLEDSDGVVRLYFCDEVMAKTEVPQLFHCSSDGAEWRLWGFKCLRWERVQALKLLQGASLQQLLGPRYYVISLHTRPPYSPVPGVDLLQVVEPTKLPPGMKDESFISLVYDRMKFGQQALFS